MDNTLDENSDNEEEFHSTTESLSSHGDLGSPALLAVHFVLASLALYKRTKSQHGTGPPPLPYPLGLPHFPSKKKGKKSGLWHTEIINEGNGYGASKGGLSSFQSNYGASKDRSSSNGLSGLSQPKNTEGLFTRSYSCPMEVLVAGTQEQPWNAPTLEKFLIKSSRSQTHVESFPLIRRRSRFESIQDCFGSEHEEENGFVSSSVKLSMDKHLDRGSFNELQSKRNDVRREPSDVEGSLCDFYLCKDGEASTATSGEMTLGSSEECVINHWERRITDTDSSHARGIPKDYIEATNISTKSPSIFPLAHVEKHSPSLDPEVEEYKDTQLGKQKKMVGENLESHHRNIHSRDGSNSMNRRMRQGTDSEGLSADRMPEAGQLESLLLWPVGLAVEVIAFQVRLVAQAFALILLLFKWCNAFTYNRVRETMHAKERATEALSQKIAVISNVPPKVTESGSVVMKRAAWGCLAAMYVCILLSMMLFPALFMDYFFWSKIVEEPVNVKEPLHFDYTLPHPAAVVSVHPSERMRNAIGKLRSHQEVARAIPNAHKVHVTVILTLPESDYNRNLGMFQLSAELLSANGQSIKISSRPCMLRFHSAPIWTLKTLLVGLPSLVGGFTESQTLVVHLMEFEEQLTPTSAVRILIQPKAGMRVGHGIPELYSADIYIDTHLPWLKNTMRNWKWTIYIWTGLMLYIMEVLMVLCCCRHALLPKTWMHVTDEEDKAEQLGGNISPAEVRGRGSLENQLSRRRRQRSVNEHMPTARAIIDQRERKLRPSESHSSL